MADRQPVQDLDQLRQLLSPRGERLAQTIDGQLVVVGADGKRYDVPWTLIAPLIEAYRLCRLSVEEATRWRAQLEEKTASLPAGEIRDPETAP